MQWPRILIWPDVERLIGTIEIVKLRLAVVLRGDGLCSQMHTLHVVIEVLAIQSCKYATPHLVPWVRGHNIKGAMLYGVVLCRVLICVYEGILLADINFSDQRGGTTKKFVTRAVKVIVV